MHYPDSCGCLCRWEGRESPAIASAETWLKLVYEGSYAENWREAAKYFKAAVKQDQWEQSMLSVKKPPGQILSRKLKSKESRTSLPGAPDGEYVIIKFDASFENKKSSIETITPLMEKMANGGYLDTISNRNTP